MHDPNKLPRIRKVSSGRWQARVWIGEPHRRHLNLGCYPSEWQANRRARAFLHGPELNAFLSYGQLPEGVLPQYVHRVTDGFSAWTVFGGRSYSAGPFPTAAEAHESLTESLPDLPPYVRATRDGFIGYRRRFGLLYQTPVVSDPQEASAMLEAMLPTVATSEDMIEASLVVDGCRFTAVNLFDPELAERSLARKIKRHQDAEPPETYAISRPAGYRWQLRKLWE